MKKVSFIVLSLLLCFGVDEVVAKAKSIRKSASRANGKRSAGRASKNIVRGNNSSNEKTEETSIQEVKTVLDRASCDSEYTRCMNKICASESLGKCVCYEDRTSNSLLTNFINIDGMKIKQGFETFEYAKRQCTEVLDKCMEDRRSVTEKYKNLVQRDCLMLSKNEAEKTKGIAGDLQELKTCLKDACTVKNIEGFEDFTFPEYSLCFNEAYAKFSIDAYCSNIIAKSSSPLGLKQMFLDEMALGRERSCKIMNGMLSNDRKKCYVTVEYGKNKDIIKASKKLAVGEYMTCAADAFDAKQSDSWEKKQKDVNNVLSLTASGFNAAGAVLSIAGTSDPIGGLVSSGIDIAEAGANLGLDVKDFADGKIDSKSMATSTISNVMSIALSSVSFAKGVKAAGDTMKTAKTLGNAGVNTANLVKNADGSFTELSKAGTNLKNTQNVLNAANIATTVAIQATDTTMENIADKAQMQDEKNAIIKYAEVDRASGRGVVNQTLSEKGNCFLNKEWFATENEIIMLLWKN